MLTGHASVEFTPDDFEFFAPYGQKIAPMGVKFGVDKLTSVDSFTAYVTASVHGCGVGPQN